MIRHKKAVLGMSMEFLVTVIISIVILGAGITLLYSFISGGETIKKELDARTSEELERLLVDQGKQVALPLHTAEVSAGKTHIFGIGILNIGNLGGNHFNIKVELSKYIDKTGTAQKAEEMDPATKEAIEKWVLYNSESMEILENEHKKESILVSVPKDASKGEYVFNAKVYLKTDLGTEPQYGITQNFYVRVK